MDHKRGASRDWRGRGNGLGSGGEPENWDDEELWWALPRDGTAPGNIRITAAGAVAYKTQTQHDTLGSKECIITSNVHVMCIVQCNANVMGVIL